MVRREEETNLIRDEPIISATDKRLTCTPNLTVRQAVELMHLYYCVKDFEAANEIRDWLQRSTGIRIHIDRDGKILQMLHGVSAVLWSYSMDDPYLNIVSQTEPERFNIGLAEFTKKFGVK